METEIPQDADQRPLTPYLVVRNAANTIEFYSAVFGAVEQFRLSETSGKIGHAELAIGPARLMLADEYPDFGALGPISVGGTPVGLHLYVGDADATVALAIERGATLLRPVKDEFYGDRVGVIVDPFGHRWQIATRKLLLSPQEMQERWSAMMQ